MKESDKVKLTTNFNLNKPEQTDAVNIEDLNANFDVLDVKIKESFDYVNLSNKPTSLPANGGNADTVGGKTVAENVPAGAKFTDTTYGVATTFANGLMSSSDKTKLNGIAEGANNYSHPSNHPPSIISQDANNRFVTDAEKSNWNGKAAGSHSHPASQVTAGTLPVGVKATDSTDYTTSRVRNARFGTTEPTSLANGEIYFMYE